MARQLRPDPPGAWHHVMNRGVARQPIFYSDEDRVAFGKLLGDATRDDGIEVHAYCLMDNHFHLLVRCPDGGLSGALQRITSRHARHVNDRLGRVGHLFGARFVSKLIDSEVYRLNVLRYVHRNPLDVSGITSPDAYRWSSHRTYLGHRARPDWLYVDTMLGEFENRPDYDRFVSAAADELGGVDPSISYQQVLAAVDAAQAERSLQAGRVVMAERSALVVGLADRLPTPIADAVRSEVGLGTSGARRSAEWRSRRWFDEHDDAEAMLAAAVELLVATPVSGTSRNGVSDPSRDVA